MSTSGSFWQSLSLDDLAKLQGVAVPPSVEELLGGWPTDELDDDFEQALEQCRPLITPHPELGTPCIRNVSHS